MMGGPPKGQAVRGEDRFDCVWLGLLSRISLYAISPSDGFQK